MAIREIRDAAGTAILALRDKVKEAGAAYDVVVGPRVGRTSSKEQYAFMYDTTVLRLLSGQYTFDDDGDGNDNVSRLSRLSPIILEIFSLARASETVMGMMLL